MDELQLSEEQVVVPVSVEQLTRNLSPSQAAAVLRQAIRGGGTFFATASGEVVHQTGRGGMTRKLSGVRHELASGITAGPRFKYDVQA